MGHYTTMNAAGLRALLKSRGLPANGKREELIKRVREDDKLRNPHLQDEDESEDNVRGKEYIVIEDEIPESEPKTVENDSKVCEYIRSNRDIIIMVLSCIPDYADICSQVCKIWRSACQDESLAWYPVYRTIQYFSYKIDKGLFHRKLSKEKQEANPDAVLKFLSSRTWGYGALFEFFRNEFPEAPKGLWMIRAAGWQVKPQYMVEFVCHINVVKLIHVLEKGTKFHKDSLFWEAVRRLSYKMADKITQHKITATTHKSALPTITQPERISKKIKLYNYQLHAIEWMKNVENTLDFGQYYPRTVTWNTRNGDILFDDHSASIDPDFVRTKLSYLPKGGVLADEMGLGKTIEVLGLVLSNPSTATLNISIPNFDDFPKLASSDVVAEYKKSFLKFLDKSKKPRKAGAKKRKIVIESETNEEWSSVDVTAYLFPTRATLVLCPPHLVAQWKSEIETNTNPPLKTVVISVIADFGTVTYEDIVNADVVLFSIPLLVNPSYFHIGHSTPATSIRRNEESIRPNWVKRYLMELLAEEESALENIAPVLDHFYWHRIVIDESHESIFNPGYGDLISRLTSKTIWCVSGTPFPTIEHCFSTMELLGFPKETKRDFASKYVWRNTKLGIKDEYETPEIVQHNFALTLHDTEKHSFAEQVASRIYCSPDVLGSYNRANGLLRHLRENSLLVIKREIKTLSTEIYDGYHLPVAHISQIKISRLCSLLSSIAFISRTKLNFSNVSPAHLMAHVSDKALAKIIEEINDLNALDIEESGVAKEKRDEEEEEELSESEVVSDMEEGEEEDEKEKPKKVGKDNKKEKKEKKEKGEKKEEKEKGGKESNKENRDTNGKKAKNATKTKKGYVEVDEKDLTEKEVKEVFIEHFGTKIGNLVFYLKRLWEKDPSARVLIFSPIPDFLIRVERSLNYVGIATGRVSGSAARRTQIISKFKSSEVKLRVLLINFNIAASGTNLIEASHIFLMHAATPETTQQAIARAHRQGQRKNVTVVRFYIKNSGDHRDLEYNMLVTEKYAEDHFKVPDLKINRSNDVANFLIKKKLVDAFPAIRARINMKDTKTEDEE